MKVVRIAVMFLISAMMLSSCVSSKKFKAQTAELEKTKNDLNDCQTNYAKAQIATKKLTQEVKDLKVQAEDAKKQLDSCNAKAAHSNELVTTLQNLNVLTNDQAQSIDQSLKTLSQAPQTKESLTAALISNIKSSIGESDTDFTVQSSKGSLYIDLTDHVFFNNGSAELTPHAKVIVGKIAKILNTYPDMHFMIEGHTDNNPIRTACIADNWDLSILRATSVIRLLQKEYQIDPKRMIAAGHAEYDPAKPNDSPANRAQNRRISIVLTPQVDQYFKLLVKK